MKTKQRWKEMGVLGATVLDEEGARVPVKTAEQAQTFFRRITTGYPLRSPIPHNGDHEWLVWLLRGHYAYSEMCPFGIDYFIVHRNSDLGHKGQALGFSVVANGARGYPRPFSIGQALLGVPKDDAERARIAFRHSIEDQISYWNKQNYRDGMLCPVFGVPLSAGNVHIDHDPPLVELIDAFCREHHTFPEKMDMAERLVAGHQQLWLVGSCLDTWREFHWRNMRLQYVSPEGHLELDKSRREKNQPTVFGAFSS